MTSVRVSTCAAGAAVAVAAGALTAASGPFGADLPKVALLGLAAGAVLGLVPTRSVGGSLAGFLGGFGAVLVALSLQRTTLPDTGLGRAIAAVVTISAVTAIATATADRVPLWAGLLGAATMTGAFALVTAGAIGTTTSAVTAATCALLAAGVSLIATTLIAALHPQAVVDLDDSPHDVTLPAPRAAADAAATSPKAAL